MTTDSYPPQTRARLEALFRADPWITNLGAELVEWGGGHATCRLPTGARHGNFVDTVHGGTLFTLADAAIGVASNSWGRVCMLLTASAQYLSAPPIGDVLVARAVERSRTRRTVALAIDVTSEDGGALRAVVQALCYRTDRWHFGEDAWPDDWRAGH